MIFKLRETKTRQAIPLPEGIFNLGRDASNAIHISDASVSRMHARLINENNELYVEDLGSSNGTAVKGQFITARTRVQVGDTLLLGHVSFQVEPEVADKGSPADVQDKETREIEAPKGVKGGKATVPSIQFITDSLSKPSKTEPSPGELIPAEAEKPIAGTTLKLPKAPRAPRPENEPLAKEANSGSRFQQAEGADGFPIPGMEEEKSTAPWMLACGLCLVLGVILGVLLQRMGLLSF